MQLYVIQHLHTIKHIDRSSNETNFKTRPWKSHLTHSAWDCFLQRESPACHCQGENPASEPFVSFEACKLSQITFNWFCNVIQFTHSMLTSWGAQRAACPLNALMHKSGKLSCVLSDYLRYQTLQPWRWPNGLTLASSCVRSPLFFATSKSFVHAYHAEMFQPPKSKGILLRPATTSQTRKSLPNQQPTPSALRRTGAPWCQSTVCQGSCR